MTVLAQRLSARLDAARETEAFRNYLTAREQVLAMLETAPEDAGRPSSYWREELQNIEYLLDASPLVIERLRQHSYHVTGVWPYRYRSSKDRERARHMLKLEALMELGGESLFVPEPPLLGGFGFPVRDGLVNLDTLKFFEVMIALDRGGALGPFRRQPRRRPVLLEIGSGWGGFAYSFKTLFESSTYVMVDLPELFLYSATYLMTAFPKATFRFWERDRPIDEDEWLAADFIFIPNTALPHLTPPHVDLTVNMVSFQEMTDEQVRAYVRHAHRLQAPLLYSLNRDRGAYNAELSSVADILDEYYSTHELWLLEVGYGYLSDEKPRRATPRSSKQPKGGYRHLIGWRRPLLMS